MLHISQTVCYCVTTHCKSPVVDLAVCVMQGVHFICAGDTSDSEAEDKSKGGSKEGFEERRGAGLPGEPSSSRSTNPPGFLTVPQRFPLAMSGRGRRPRSRR